MAEKIDGYKEAAKIDKKINSLLEKYPIEENIMEWGKLARTIKTSMIILEALIKEEREQNG